MKNSTVAGTFWPRLGLLEGWFWYETGLPTSKTACLKAFLPATGKWSSKGTGPECTSQNLGLLLNMSTASAEAHSEIFLMLDCSTPHIAINNNYTSGTYQAVWMPIYGQSHEQLTRQGWTAETFPRAKGILRKMTDWNESTEFMAFLKHVRFPLFWVLGLSSQRGSKMLQAMGYCWHSAESWISLGIQLKHSS